MHMVAGPFICDSGDKQARGPKPNAIGTAALRQGPPFARSVSTKTVRSLPLAQPGVVITVHAAHRWWWCTHHGTLVTGHPTVPRLTRSTAGV